jgi:hypothetical protein
MGISSAKVSVQPGIKAPPSAPSKFVLTLDGKKAEALQSFRGGELHGTVATEKTGGKYYLGKSIADARYTPFVLEAGFGMDATFYQWIATGWAFDGGLRHGSVIGVDDQGEVRSQIDFDQASITETIIPAMDVTAKGAGYLTVKIKPEIVRPQAPSGKVALAPESRNKIFMPSQFKLEIAGLDCSGVTKVDSFTVKQSEASNVVGVTREPTDEPGLLNFPDLRIELTSATRKSWDAFITSFLLEGKHTEQDEKEGALTLLSTDSKTTLATIHLHNLGIYGLTDLHDRSRVAASLYCEWMELEVPKG